MNYGVLSSGDVIDSVSTESEALALVSSLLDAPDTDADLIGLLVVDDDGDTRACLHGRSLADAVDSGEIPRYVYT